MKTIVILGDGMADKAVERLGGKTLLQYADTPYMDMLARRGRTGRLITIPDGFQPGSEVANTAILGYDLNEVYEGRGPLEAASIGYEMQPDDMAIRCNIIQIECDHILNHHGGHLTTEQSRPLIDRLNEQLGSDSVKFITGIQYRHLLIIKGGSKHITCAPPHDHPGEPWRPLLVKPEPGWENKREEGRMTAQETADLLNDLIVKSQDILVGREERGVRSENTLANFQLPTSNSQVISHSPLPTPHSSLRRSIWPWSGGYRPSMQTISQLYPQVKRGAVISAVDLIRGIGHYAGLRNIIVEGATGLADTNYEGKAAAAIEALRTDDFVFLHLEASDEAGHDGDLDLKLRTIEYLDHRIVEPIYNEVKTWDAPVCIAVLPDHLTPVEMRIHVGEPVPFLIWHRGIAPDSVQLYDEVSCASGSYGLLRLQQFMQTLMSI